MILREARKRPDAWKDLKARLRPQIFTPFIAFDWIWEWVAYFLSNWRFLEVLEYLGSFSVLVAIVFYFSETGDRIKQRHYQAWQVVNTAQGKGGSGGRVEALQELNSDHVPLVGVDVSDAFLRGIHLEHANLLRSDFSSTDMQKSNFSQAIFTDASLHFANCRECNFYGVDFQEADLSDSDLQNSSLAGANLAGADLSRADLSYTDLRDIQWKRIKAINGAIVRGVKNAPDGFIEYALKNGATRADSSNN